MNVWSVIYRNTPLKTRMVGGVVFQKRIGTIAVFETKEEAEAFCRANAGFDLIPVRVIIDEPLGTAQGTKQERGLESSGSPKARKHGTGLPPCVPASGR